MKRSLPFFRTSLVTYTSQQEVYWNPTGALRAGGNGQWEMLLQTIKHVQEICRIGIISKRI